MKLLKQLFIGMVAALVVAGCSGSDAGADVTQSKGTNAAAATTGAAGGESAAKDNPQTEDNLEASHEDHLDDSLSSEEKAKLVTGESKANHCGVCGRKCCDPCFANDVPTCAQTKFRECSICGHASASHSIY